MGSNPILSAHKQIPQTQENPVFSRVCGVFRLLANVSSKSPMQKAPPLPSSFLLYSPISGSVAFANDTSSFLLFPLCACLLLAGSLFPTTMELMPMSRDQLYDQLIFDGFTDISADRDYPDHWSRSHPRDLICKIRNSRPALWTSRTATYIA